MARKGTKERHAADARDRLATAQHYERIAQQAPGAAGLSMLTLAHCEACSATELAAQAGAENLRVRAAEISARIAGRFHPQGNPITPEAPAARKPKKGTGKRTTRAERKRILRRLLRL